MERKFHQSSFHTYYLNLDWFSLARGVVVTQWGDFGFSLLTDLTMSENRGPCALEIHKQTHLQGYSN